MLDDVKLEVDDDDENSEAEIEGLPLSTNINRPGLNETKGCSTKERCKVARPFAMRPPVPAVRLRLVTALVTDYRVACRRFASALLAELGKLGHQAASEARRAAR